MAKVNVKAKEVEKKKNVKEAPKKKLAATPVKKPNKRLSAKEKITKIFETTVLEHRENGRKLSRSILRRWRVHMPLDEVDSIVDLALCEAAQRFSPTKGASFMTFFFYHLRGHLVRAVARATQINNFQATIEGDTENEADLSNYSQYIHLVDQELYSQREQETPEELVLRREKIGVCRDALDSLDSLEKVVLERSYADDEALVDIASTLGYSRCHISRVKKSAMIKLKGNLLSTVHFSGPQTEILEEETQKVRIERPIRRKAILIKHKTKEIQRANKKAA